MATGSGTGTPITGPAPVVTYTDPDRSGTLLPLDEWRRLMRFNPWTFWQLWKQGIPAASDCSPIVFEHDWRNPLATGREDVREAIRQAEFKLKKVLGYSIAPAYEQDRASFPKFHQHGLTYRRSEDARGRWNSIRTEWGNVQAIGALTKTYLGDPAVVLSDPDGDGLKERFTLSIATTATDPAALAVYFSAGDRLDTLGPRERWRVAPVETTISGGVATIVGRAWTIVRPVLYEDTTLNAIDPSSAGNFVGTLAVYVIGSDTANQGQFIWETLPDGCECPEPSLNLNDPSAIYTHGARFVIRHHAVGRVAGEIAELQTDGVTWAAAAWTTCHDPERVTINYTAGQPLMQGAVDPDLALMCARLATAELTAPPCACDDQRRELTRWTMDAGMEFEGQNYKPSFDAMKNPWGTRRGQIEVWQQAIDMAVWRGSIA
jgi:hypothetical protein